MKIEKVIEITQKQIEALKIELITFVTQEYISCYKLAIEVKEIALQALQEKLEREKGCEYCNPNLRKNGTGNMNNYIDGSRLIMKITKSECRQITSGFNDYYFKETHEKHQIWVEYCPHCGRKLWKENNDT